MPRSRILTATAVLVAVCTLLGAMNGTTTPPKETAFKPLLDRIQPAPRNGGFQRDDSWIWCGSVIRGDDGRWHMFASMWSKTVSFAPNWVTNSRVVRAVADRPEGPYRYVEDVLPPRDGDYWDGRMTHNPTVRRIGNTYLLFYTGTTYREPVPDKTIAPDSPLWLEARANQRIGLATAPSPAGPWTRSDRPILDVRPGRWDALLTTNPAPCVEPDGSILLLYKSAATERGALKYGVAHADNFHGPYRRLREEPIEWAEDSTISYEDAFVWHESGQYRMIFNDMTGKLTGEDHAGAYAVSADGINWRLGTPPKAYSRRIRWDDGTETVQGSLERPQLLMQDGHPTHLVCATADGPGGFRNATRTWSIVIPLQP